MFVWLYPLRATLVDVSSSHCYIYLNTRHISVQLAKACTSLKVTATAAVLSYVDTGPPFTCSAFTCNSLLELSVFLIYILLYLSVALFTVSPLFRYEAVLACSCFLDSVYSSCSAMLFCCGVVCVDSGVGTVHDGFVLLFGILYL
jgi:hypothetical protein